MDVMQFKIHVGSDGYLKTYIATNFPNRDVEVIVVMQPLEGIEDRCEYMSIEDLNVSEGCLKSLRAGGFITVGDLTHFFEQTWGGRATVDPHPEFLKHLDETVNKLKEIGCWPESLKDE
jgi:hypothetical protein